MEDLKLIIAGNLTALRKAKNLTQAELASMLNYSDKAVSKWERGESVPDVTVLKELADMFGVTLDYLTKAEHTENNAVSPKAHKRRSVNRVIITLLSVTLVFFIATVVFVVLGLFSVNMGRLWIIYIYSIPAACIVLLVFNTLWGKRFFSFIIITVLLWSVLLTLYLAFLSRDIWLVFIIGVPAQIIILLWANLKQKKQTPV